MKPDARSSPDPRRRADARAFRSHVASRIIGRRQPDPPRLSSAARSSIANGRHLNVLGCALAKPPTDEATKGIDNMGDGSRTDGYRKLRVLRARLTSKEKRLPGCCRTHPRLGSARSTLFDAQCAARGLLLDAAVAIATIWHPSGLARADFSGAILPPRAEAVACRDRPRIRVTVVFGRVTDRDSSTELCEGSNRRGLGSKAHVPRGTCRRMRVGGGLIESAACRPRPAFRPSTHARVLRSIAEHSGVVGTLRSLPTPGA